MQLRRVDVAGLARARDDLAAFDLVAALDQELLGMGVSGDVAVGMAHENEVAVPFEFAAGIGHDPVFGGFHRRVLRHRELVCRLLPEKKKKPPHARCSRPSACSPVATPWRLRASATLPWCTWSPRYPPHRPTCF